MTRYSDEAVKAALLEIAPEDKANIEAAKLGEIEDPDQMPKRRSHRRCHPISSVRPLPALVNSQRLGYPYLVAISLLVAGDHWPSSHVEALAEVNNFGE